MRLLMALLINSQRAFYVYFCEYTLVFANNKISLHSDHARSKKRSGKLATIETTEG